MRPGRVAAVLLALPAALTVVGRGGEGWWLALLAFLLPALLGRRDAPAILSWGVALAFAAPLWPVLARSSPIAVERIAVHGALAALAWRGELRLAPSTPRLRVARGLLIAWLAWSAGGALRGLVANLPEGAPWLGWTIAEALLDPLGRRSLTDSTAPLLALGLRAEMLLLLFACMELSARRPEWTRALAGALAAAVVLGFAAAFLDVALASRWRGESFLVRYRYGLNIPRSHRPLVDHNALGSALVLVLPQVAWLAFRAWRERRRAGTAAVVWSAGALLLGLGLLWSSRSKAAFGALALGGLLWAALTAASGGARARRLVTWLAAAGVAVVLVVNLLPRGALEAISSSRRGEDVLRLVHRNGLVGYLRHNRVAMWHGAWRMTAAHPVLGVGLGNHPARFADHREERPTWSFNPLHENAHSQYLQWSAEEGIPGLALGVALLLLALGSGLRGPPERRAELRLLACALAALLLNLAAGHSLLEPSVAALFAATAGALLGLAAGPGDDGPALPRLARLAAPVLLVASALPVAWAARAPLDGYATGCFPWQKGTPRTRVLGPDARWVQRWGSGTRLVLPLVDVRPLQIEGAQRVSVWLDGVLVVDRRELPRAHDVSMLNPTIPLPLDAPPGVGEGDLVELRVVSEPPFSPIEIWDRDHSVLGARMLEPFFKDVR